MKKSYFIIVSLFLTANLYSQTTYVPDDNFEQALINLGYDTGTLDDYVPTANIKKVSYLDISRKNISDLTGIKDFVNLQILICNDNLLSSIDISQNTELTHLEFNNNPKSSFDFNPISRFDMINNYNSQFVNLFNLRR
jgi:hypothetical protein